MKKTFTLFLVTMLLMLSGQILKAQYQNIPISPGSFTGDVVANGAATSTNSTTVDADDAGFCFVSSDFNPGSGICTGSAGYFWPSTITSPGVTGLTYTLQSATGNNVFQVGSTAIGTLNLATPTAVNKLYVLFCSAVSGSSTITSVVVNFSDGINPQTFSNVADINWCQSLSPSTTTFYRTGRNTTTTCAIGTCQYLTEMTLALSAGNQSRLVSSITFNNGSGKLSVFALGAYVPNAPYLLAAPTSLAFNYIAYGNTSAAQSFSLNGGILTSNGTISLTAPTGYSMCLTSGGTYTNSLSIPYTGTTLPATTIYVKFTPLAANTTYNSNITASGGGVTSYTIPVTGTSSLVYCTPTYSLGGASDYMTQVTLGTLSQATASNTSPYYIDYTTTQNAVPSLMPGSSYNLVLTFGADASQYNGVWIDFDKSGTFDTGEFFTSNTNAGASGTATVVIAVPANATPGTTRMRIRGADDSQPTSAQACGASNSSYGQAQDFSVNILSLTTPYLISSPASNNFNYAAFGSSSAYQTFNISGANLTGSPGNITITAPSGFQVSLSSGTGYGSSVSIAYTSATLASTPIYAKFVPLAANTSYSANMTISGGGASTTVLLQGTSSLIYCTSVPEVSGYDYISNVTFGGINNSSGVSYYTDYTSSVAAQVTQTISAPLSITIANPECTTCTNYFAVWIDLNQDGVFNQTNELVYSGTYTAATTLNTTITIPTTSTTGTTRMRIITNYYYQPTTACWTYPTNNYIYGETEDYKVNIIAAAACVAPTVQPTGITLAPAAGGTVTGSFTAASNADHYLVVRSKSSNPTPPQNGTTYTVGQVITGTGTNNDTVVAYQSGISISDAGLSANVTYYYYVYAANSNCTGTVPMYCSLAPLSGNVTNTCLAPTAQPTTLALIPGAGGTLTGSFTVSTGGSDHYLIVRNTTGNTPIAPTNGQTYSGSNPLGTSTFVAYSTSGAFSDAGLIANSTYYYYVYAENSNCAGSPLYYNANPLSGSVVNVCLAPTAQPTAFVLSLGASNTISGSFTASVGGADHYLIVRSSSTNPTLPSNNITYNTVGQIITGTGSNDTVVAYQTGTSFTDIGLAGVLNPGKIYYYYVFAANANCAGTPQYCVATSLKGTVTTPFTSTGSWVCPTGVTSVTVQCWGGGGGGGYTTGAAFKGGGGGGGAYAAGTYTVTPGSSYTCSVGSGGVGSTGGVGGKSSFVNVNTIMANGGTGALAATTGGAGGDSATCKGNIIRRYGGKGGDGSTNSGSGGGAAGPTANGGVGSGTSTIGGTAGATNPNSGIGAVGLTTSGVGVDGSLYGGGGSGAYSTGTAYAGGSGAKGAVIITVNCNTQPTGLTFTPAPTSIAGTFIASASADHYLIVVNTTGTVPTVPTNSKIYNTGDTLGAGTATVVSYQTTTTFNNTGLTGNTHYYYYIYGAVAIPFGGGATYLTTSPLAVSTYTSCAAPTVQPTVLNLTPSTSSIAGSFTASASTDHYLILRSTSSTYGSVLPVNGTTYSAGMVIGNDTVVSFPATTTFNDNGSAGVLHPNTLYYYYIFAANANCTGGGTVSYFTTSPLSNSSYTSCTAPTTQPTVLTLNPTSNSISGSFTAATTADHYLIIRATSNTLAAIPTNGKSYSTGDTLGNALGKVVAYQTTTSFSDLSLNYNTHYYYYVYAARANTCSAGPAYLTTSPLTRDTTTLCGSPALQPTILSLTPSFNSVTGSFNRSVTADNYLIFRSTSATFSSSLPVNTTTYLPGNTLGVDTVISFQTDTSFIDNSLISNIDYYYFIFSTNANCTAGPVYLTTSPLSNSTTTLINTPCVAPTNPPTGLTLTPGATTIGGTFTSAVGGADYYLIIRSTSGTLGSTPQNGVLYTTGSSFGGGVIIAYQLGTSTSFTDIGLTSGTHYYYYIYSANSICTGGPLYSPTSLTNDSYTNCVAPLVQPTNLAFIATTSTISGHFTPSVTADHYLIIRSTLSTTPTIPVNGTTYNPGTSILSVGDSVIAYSTDTTFIDNGQHTAGVQYYYWIYAAKASNCSGGIVYLNTSPLTGSTYTSCLAPTAQPTSLVISSSGTSTVNISFTAPTPAPDHYLIVRSSSTNPTPPLNGTIYSAGQVIIGTGNNDTVVAYQTGTSFTNTGLNASTTYHYYIFAANSTNCSVSKYLTSSPLSGNVITGQLQNIPCIGFNQDVVAEGASISTSTTTSTVDNTASVLVSNTFTSGSGNVCTTTNTYTTTMPTTGGSGLSYTLQPVNVNNALQFTVNTTSATSGSGTLTLNNPILANSLYFLAMLGNGSTGATITATVNFSDATTQQFTNLAFTDWTSVPTAGSALVNHTPRGTSTTCTLSLTNYFTESAVLNISAANQSKLISSVTFTGIESGGQGTFNVFALSGAVIITPCSIPVNQPVSLTLSPTSSSSISGSFPAATGHADQYLIVRSTSNTLSSVPINTTLYTAGQPLNGFVNDTVIGYQTTRTFTDNGRSIGTRYYYSVFSANSNCSGGPLYLTTSPDTASKTTNCPPPANQPTGLTFNTPSYTTISGSFTASTSADHYLIVRNSTGNIPTVPINGTVYTPLSSVLSPGDSVIAYQTTTSISDIGLISATQYYYYIYAANSSCYGGPSYLILSPLTAVTSTNSTPTITSLGTTHGCIGSSLTINGTYLLGATAVSIGGTNVASFTVINATSIMAVVGNGTTGTVSVTTSFGIATSTATYTVNTSNPFTVAPKLFGSASICPGGSTNLTLHVTNSAGPFTLTYHPSGGTNQVVTGLVDGSTFPVSPSVTTYYQIISVVDTNTCVSSGNIVSNPSGELGTTVWSFTSVGSGWIVENTPPDFATSSASEYKSQNVDLIAAGYTAAELDLQPYIYVSDQYSTRADQAGYYGFLTQLRNASNTSVATWGNPSGYVTPSTPVYNTLTASVPWTTTSYTYPGTYGTGVRYVYLEDAGHDAQSWLGNYGARMRNTTVNVYPVVRIVGNTIIASQSTATQTQCLNSSFTPISVNVSNATANTTYQWYSNTTASNINGTSLGIVNGAQTSSYTPQSTVVGTLYYYCVVNGCGTAVTSAVSGAIIVNPSTSISSQSTLTQSSCINGTFNPISVAANGTGTITYQWYKNTSASTTGGNALGSANGAQTNSYTPQATSTGTLYYYCNVHSDCGSNVKSTISGAFIVNTVSVGGTATAIHPIVCYNSNDTITLSGNTGNIQWQQSADGISGWANVTGGSGANTATYTTPNLTVKTYYKAIVTSGACSSSISNIVSVLFQTPTSQPTNLTLATGVTTVSGSFTASASADHYLVVRSTSNTLTATPLNGTIYNLGDILGEGTISGYQTSTNINDVGLLPNTLYYYYIFSANNLNCTNGPVYLTTLPLTGSAQTAIPQVTNKTLKVIAMFQEYFNSSTGLMNQTLGINWDTGDLFKNFPGTTVDTVTVLIRKTNITADVVSSFPIDTVFYGVNLNNDGLITISLSAGITGYHYIEIKHRNSIETWSDTVNFSTDTVKYDFYNYISQFAYDNGMLQDGTHAWIWGGDVNQNGNLESEDATIIYVAANSDDPTVNNGYVICDIDGNGNLDSQDYGLSYNNANTGANIINPFSYLKKK